jgi:hypothetical protein
MFDSIETVLFRRVKTPCSGFFMECYLKEMNEQFQIINIIWNMKPNLFSELLFADRNMKA